MRSAVYRAVDFDKGAAPQVSQEPLWRQIEALDPGAFPPNVAFVCEIVAGIHQYFGNIIESEEERSRTAAEAATSKGSGGGIVSRFKRFIGTNVAPPAKAPENPEWLPLIREAHTEAGNWLNALRARSYEEELTHDERARFL